MVKCSGEVDGQRLGRVEAGVGGGEIGPGVDVVGCSVAVEVEIVVPVESLETVCGVVVIELVDGEGAVQGNGVLVA